MSLFNTLETDAQNAYLRARQVVQLPAIVQAVPGTAWLAGGAGVLMLLLFSGKHRQRKYR